MAQYDYPRALLQRAVREGRNASDALREFRAAGGRVRTQTWYRLYGQVQVEANMAGVEAAQPLNRIPNPEHIQTMTTVRRSGYLQRARIFGREPGGLVISKQITFRVDRLHSRQAIIEKAADLLTSHGGQFPQAPDSIPIAVIGGVYAGTYEAVPEH